MSGTHDFKFEAPDGKMRKADVLDFEGVQTLAKNYPNTRAGAFFDWSKIDKNEYLAAMRKSPIDDSDIRRLLRNALTDQINDRELFMKGIDYSYYYEQSEN